MNPFDAKSKDKPRRRFDILDNMKKLIVVIIIIFAIAVIFFSIPGIRVSKMYLPPIF
jgi:hypothetical protein